MNVLLAAGPESTTVFTLTVQESGRSAGRLIGQRHITVPLNRLQSTYRRLLLAGNTILAVTPCKPMGDPPPLPHPGPGAAPDGLSASEAFSEAVSVTASSSAPTAPPAETTTRPHPVEHAPTPARQDQAAEETSVGEDAMVLLLSVLGVLILLTLRVVQHLAQQWGIHVQAQRQPQPPTVGVQKRELANC